MKENKYKFIDYSSINFNTDDMNYEYARFICTILRMNIVSSIQLAKSGHLGTSLSSLEIICASLSFLNKFGNKGLFLSSKGHDAPAIYNVMELFNILPENSNKKLRRLKGLPGHPDVGTDGIMFNTGSLGMGISKVNGFLSSSSKNKAIVLIGDGEFQEGQIFESLSYLENNVQIIPLIFMDNNRIQSDTWIEKVKSFNNLEKK